MRQLKAQGVEIEVGPAERFGAGGRGASVYFRYPDGSLLEFIAYPAKSQAARRLGAALRSCGRFARAPRHDGSKTKRETC